MYSPRVGRFFAVDPLAGKYPWNSPYAFSENRVIDSRELEGLEGLHYTKIDKNGRTIHTIEKNIVILIRPLEAINNNMNPKKKKRIEKRNARIKIYNQQRVEKVKSELKNFYGDAKNSKGEIVNFKFNFTTIIHNSKNKKYKERFKDYNQTAKKYGSSGIKYSDISGIPDLELPIKAAVLTLESSSSLGDTKFNTVMSVNSDSPDGTIAHEVIHTLGLDDNGYTNGGLLNSPPEHILPSEVDEILKKAYEKK